MAKWKRNRSLLRRWQRNQLIAKYGAICYLCGEPFASARDITIDHWQPLSKGGPDSLENYRLAYDKCNQLKADLTPEEFAEYQQGRLKWE